MLIVDERTIIEHGQRLLRNYNRISMCADRVEQVARQGSEYTPREVAQVLYKMAEVIRKRNEQLARFERASERIAEEYAYCEQRALMRAEEDSLRSIRPTWNYINLSETAAILNDITIV